MEPPVKRSKIEERAHELLQKIRGYSNGVGGASLEACLWNGKLRPAQCDTLAGKATQCANATQSASQKLECEAFAAKALDYNLLFRELKAQPLRYLQHPNEASATGSID